jgi:hypothetical protein
MPCDTPSGLRNVLTKPEDEVKSQEQIWRLGFFRISREVDRRSIGAACSEVVWNAGDRLQDVGYGISDEFDEIQIGYDSIPWYEWEIKDGRATATRVSLRG